MKQTALWFIASACMVFGIAKATFPHKFLALRRSFPRLSGLSFYDFLYKSKHAVWVVRINGYVLIAIAVVVFGLLATS